MGFSVFCLPATRVTMLPSVFALCGRRCMGTIRRVPVCVQLTPRPGKRKDQAILKPLVGSPCCCFSPRLSIHPVLSFSSPAPPLPHILLSVLALRLSRTAVPAERELATHCSVSQDFRYVKEHILYTDKHTSLDIRQQTEG